MRLSVLLSVYWFFLMGALGIFFPYYSLYLSDTVGLSATRTGIVMGVLPLVGMLAQPLWGQLADRSGSRTRILFALSLGTTIGFAALMFAHSFAAILITTALMAVFFVSTVPMFVAVSMALLGTEASRRFGYFRVCPFGRVSVSVWQGLPLGTVTSR